MDCPTHPSSGNSTRGGNEIVRVVTTLVDRYPETSGPPTAVPAATGVVVKCVTTAVASSNCGSSFPTVGVTTVPPAPAVLSRWSATGTVAFAVDTPSTETRVTRTVLV